MNILKFKNKFHGILSLLMIFSAFAIGFSSILSISRMYGFLYLGLIVISGSTIVFCFCTKCPCKDSNCGHVFPGLLTKILPDRTPGRYTKTETGIVIISFASALAFPQYFLWTNKTVFIIFWLLMAVSLIDIRFHVCKACDNQYCPAKKLEY
jgi:hypothetical protein